MHSRTYRLARVQSGAGRIDMLAEAFLTLRTARQVRQAGIERNVPSVLDELIGTRVVATMTTSRHFRAAIQNELDREINLFTLSLTGDLDSVRKGRNRAMSPARATILREVLIQRMR